MILGGAFGGTGVVGPDPQTGDEANYVVMGTGNSVVARISTADGSVERLRYLSGEWALPAVTYLGDAGGLSVDGSTLVLTNQFRHGHTSTDFRILDPRSLRPVDHVKLPGTWSFDALSPDGGLMYLVQYRHPRDPFDYRVRQYDLRTDTLRHGALVDPDEPDEKMTGQPISRVTSADGADVYTLYGGGGSVFIHALHTDIGQADCIDLDQVDPKSNVYNLRLRIDPGSGIVSVLSGGRLVALVDPHTLLAHNPPTAGLSAAVERGEQQPSQTSAATPWIGVGAIGAGLALAALVSLMVLRRRSQGGGTAH